MIIMVLNGENVLALLRGNPEGLDIIKIAKQLNADIRDVRSILNELQDNRKINTGLVKREGRPTYFERMYYATG